LAHHSRPAREAAVAIELPRQHGDQLFRVDAQRRAPVGLELAIDRLLQRSLLGRTEIGRRGAAALGTLAGAGAFEEVGADAAAAAAGGRARPRCRRWRATRGRRGPRWVRAAALPRAAVAAEVRVWRPPRAGRWARAPARVQAQEQARGQWRPAARPRDRETWIPGSPRRLD